MPTGKILAKLYRKVPHMRPAKKKKISEIGPIVLEKKLFECLFTLYGQNDYFKDHDHFLPSTHEYSL